MTVFLRISETSVVNMNNVVSIQIGGTPDEPELALVTTAIDSTEDDGGQLPYIIRLDGADATALLRWISTHAKTTS